MSVEIMLVSGEPLMLNRVRERFADPGVEAVLGEPTFGGTPEEFPHLTRVDTPRLGIDMYGPIESRTGGGIAPYSTDLGVVAPTDKTGSSWRTHVEIVRGTDDDSAVGALFGVLAVLAADGSGYVVVDGQIVDLPGVPPPTPDLTGRTAPPPYDLAAGQAYQSVFLPLTVASDAAGWTRVVDLVRALSAGVPEVWPSAIDVEGDWRPFDENSAPPSWWPMEQQLAGDDPAVAWDLAPASFPGENLTAVLMNATLTPAATERLLPTLLTLDVSYAFLHHWTPGQQIPDSPAGLRIDDPDREPWLMLTERQLRVALPGPFWAQVIGPEWEAAIGRDRLATCPAYRVEEVGPHRWLVQLTPSAAETGRLARARAAVRDHFGADLFWTRGKDETARVSFAPSSSRSAKD